MKKKEEEDKNTIAAAPATITTLNTVFVAELHIAKESELFYFFCHFLLLLLVENRILNWNLIYRA